MAQAILYSSLTFAVARGRSRSNNRKQGACAVRGEHPIKERSRLTSRSSSLLIFISSALLLSLIFEGLKLIYQIKKKDQRFNLKDKMQKTYILEAALVSLLLVNTMAAVPYPPALDRIGSEDYNDNNNLENLMRTDKRACIRRGGGCDGKPNDCCANSSCRCNLWGTNCRCERAGLFQQWGK